MLKVRLNDMTKNKAMKGSNDAKECSLFDRPMNGRKDEVMPKMLTFPAQMRDEKDKR